MLPMITEGEPLSMVLGVTGIEAGFEAWRQLMNWYDPCNAYNETDVVNQLITLKRVKEPKDIPHAIYNWEQQMGQIRREDWRETPRQMAQRIAHEATASRL